MSNETQGELFEQVRTPYGADFRVLARRDDPQTSQEAAGEICEKLGKLQQLFLSILKRAGRPMTAMEVAAIASPDNHASRESIRKRAGELGKLIKKHDKRNCRVTGKLAWTYICR
jgi:hypothetical protein